MSYGRSLTEWAEEVHFISKSKGWHDDQPATPERAALRIALIHSELSELLETFRDDPNAPCPKLNSSGQPIGITCSAEELADVLIRVLDFAREFGINIEEAVRQKNEYNMTRKHRHGGRRF